jgi:hypothetical protein
MQELLAKQVPMMSVVLFGCIMLVLGVAGGVLSARDTVYDYALTVDQGGGTSVALQYGMWPELSNSNFFTTVRDGFIAEKASFVEANLTAMTIVVYQNGEEVLTVPIKSKGKDGSWWETPSGLYRAEAKEDTHFSSFGQVYMPWSIPFQGNFFIHGWPYHEDGTPVPEGYSGGCMRLEDVYAKQVYDLVEVGMPILVFEEAQLRGETTPYVLDVPPLSAQSYLVADLESNFVLLAGNEHIVRESTLMSTLMTALVSSEHQNIEKTLKVRESMLTGREESGIQSGSTYSLYDLYFPLLLAGSKDAKGALSGYFGDKRFATLLTTKAGALGMKHTKFTGTGSDLGEKTTAGDAFLLLKYLYTNRPFVLTMSAGKTNLITYGSPRITVLPTHPFATDTRFVGGVSEPLGHIPYSANSSAAVALVFATTTETSTTDDHADIISVFTPMFEGSERPIAVVALDSEDPSADTASMLEYVERMYR